jgi:hypothetical protein
MCELYLKCQYCLQNCRHLALCPQLSFGRFVQQKLVKPCLLRYWYSVLQLSSFEEVLSVFTNILT